MLQKIVTIIIINNNNNKIIIIIIISIGLLLFLFACARFSYRVHFIIGLWAVKSACKETQLNYYYIPLPSINVCYTYVFFSLLIASWLSRWHQLNRYYLLVNGTCC
jgi:hypothetical protein